MTYKYLYVRRAIYEENPANKLKSYRSLSDMARLFKLPFWIMSGVLLIALIFFLIITILNPKSFLIWIPVIIFLVLMVSPIPREKYFYNNLARMNELTEIMQDYKQYVSNIWKTLRNNGIDTPEKVIKLKDECETILKMREDKFAKINSKIVDMLIGVPLGALIASIIYVDRDAVPITIVIIIFVGITFLGIVKLIRFINYYSDEYFKDEYLLEAINELNYFEDLIASSSIILCAKNMEQL